MTSMNRTESEPKGDLKFGQVWLQSLHVENAHRRNCFRVGKVRHHLL